jgi:hypothetical protein
MVWLSAQSAESLASSYRQFMTETTNSSDRDTDELISDVKTRLFRSKIPWLLVFDNLEDPSLLSKFVPHSSGCGPVLVTMPGWVGHVPAPAQRGGPDHLRRGHGRRRQVPGQHDEGRDRPAPDLHHDERLGGGRPRVSEARIRELANS